jgi:dTDP-4-dehydrorhamnose reductase
MMHCKHASGQLGTDLCRVLAVHHIISCTHEDLEITDSDQIRTVLSEHHPDVVINTAAYHKVDECESFPEKTFAVNAIGPRNLAVACRDADILLIHISTNFVFNGYGERPYREDDLPLPLSVYGTAKLAGEHLVRSIWKRHFLIRTTGLYGHSKGAGGKGHNFIELMIKLGKERGGRRYHLIVDHRYPSTFFTQLDHKFNEVVALPSCSFGMTVKPCCTNKKMTFPDRTHQMFACQLSRSIYT